MKGNRFAILLFTVVACAHGSGQGCGHDDAPDFDTCTDVKRLLWDPGGQGRELLGFGVHIKDAGRILFGGIDEFVPSRVSFKDHGEKVKVDDFSIRDFEMIGARHDAPGHWLEPQEWIDAQFEGQLTCLNPKLVKNHKQKKIAVTVKIMNYIDHPIEREKLTSFVPHKSVTTVVAPRHAYSFHIFDDKGNDRGSPCIDSEDAVVPIAGYWDRKLEYDRSASRFSFICLKKNLAKCLFDGNYSLGAPQGNEPDWLEACAHMMQADYCGDGSSFTKENTEIRAWDTTGQPTPNPKLVFEAAWDARGMVCYDKLRWPLKEWEEQNHHAPCVNDERKCCGPGDPVPCTPDVVAAKFPNKPMIFTQSCAAHPCDLEPLHAPVTSMTGK